MEPEGEIQTVRRGNVEIRILRNKCIGAGTCVVYGPETFDLDGQNIAVAKNGEWDNFDKIVAAAESCPVCAIEIYKDGQKIYPRS